MEKGARFLNLIENERKRFWGSVAKPAGKLITGDQRLHLQHLMTFWAPLSGTKIAEHNKLSWGRGGVGGGGVTCQQIEKSAKSSSPM